MAKRRKGKSRKSSRAAFFGIGASIAEPVMAFGWGYGRTALLSAGPVQSALAVVPGGPYADNILFGGGAAAITLLFRPTGIAHQALKIITLSEAFNAGQKMGYGISMTASAGSSGTPVIM